MALLAAIRFLTVLPLPARPPTAQELAAAATYFPAVGLLIGLALAAVALPLNLLLPQPVVAALLLVLLLGITGGLHVDGLADTCDGFFCNAESPARRLEIMRDSRVGGYGVAGVVSVMLVQYAAIASQPAGTLTAALALMATLSRWAMTYALVAFPYARSDLPTLPGRPGDSPSESESSTGQAGGMGTPFQPASRTRTLLSGTLFTLAVSVLLAGATGVLLLAVVWLGTWLMARALMARLPGLTGDTYGAINEDIQALVLLFLLARPPSP